jgi:polysaccharide export outer membrane protein
MLDLHFEFTPEFNQSNVPVQPDGFASLSGVGDVHVAGLTVPELKQTLQDVYGKILAKPVITVTLRDFNKPYFIATGQVGKPGKYDLRANTTVIEAIGIAGGMNDTSKHSEVWVFHRMPDGSVQNRRVNVKQMLASGNLNEDGRIQPGDTIFVPQNTASKIKNFLAPSIGAAIMPGRP